MSGVGTLSGGTKKITQASSQVKSGIKSLNSGAKTLNDGQKKFYKDGIKKLYDTVNDDLMDIVDRFKALKTEEVSYTSFADRAEGMDGSVKFIYETEPIEVNDEQ